MDRPLTNKETMQGITAFCLFVGLCLILLSFCYFIGYDTGHTHAVKEIKGYCQPTQKGGDDDK